MATADLGLASSRVASLDPLSADARSAPRLPFSRMGDVSVVCALAMLLVVYWSRLAGGESSQTLSLIVFVLVAGIAVHASRVLGDALNSLTVLLVLCSARIALPAVLLLVSDIPPDTFLPIFNVTRESLIEGQELAAAGVLAAVVGWYACPPCLVAAATSLHRFAGRAMADDPRMVPSAAIALAAGVAAALIYLAVNFGNPLTPAFSGVARGSTVAGTSRYGVAASGLLITGALVLSLYLARRPSVPRIVVFLPALLAGLVLTTFGGRLGALTPLGLAVIGVYYLRRPPVPGRARRVRLARVALGAVIAVTALFAYFSFVSEYRGGGGAGAISTVLRGDALRDYAKFSMWSEIGTLHSYALADRLGPGTLAGSTYPEALGYVGSALGVHGQRPGQVMVERFGPGFETPWAFHTGLVVDVFVNSGLIAALLSAVLFGAVLRAEYVGFRRARARVGSTFIHCLSLWTLVWVFFESVIVLPSQFQLALPIVGLVLLGAHVLPDTRSAAAGVSGAPKRERALGRLRAPRA